MDHIQAMRVFVQVAENHSFRRAAQHLTVSNALATRAIAMLEAQLHVRLLNRTTRTLSLTEAGAQYLDGCRSLLEELDQLEAAISCSDGEPGGTLRVVAAGALSMTSLTGLLDGYRKRYPKVKLHVTISEKRVDLIEGGFDVGLVTGSMTSGTEFVEHPLVTNPMVAVASPAYLRQHDVPGSPGDLARHGFIGLQQESREAAWGFRHRDGSSQSVKLEPSYSVNNALMVRQAALAGMGPAIVPQDVAAADLKEGTLVRLIPDYSIDDPEVSMSIVYPSRKYLAAKTRLFVEYVLACFSFGEEVDLRRGDPEVEALKAASRHGFPIAAAAYGGGHAAR
jgi:DNA-binding transcriptional LysR family regulator